MAAGKKRAETKPSVAVIGCGNLGGALVNGLSMSQELGNVGIIACDHDEEVFESFEDIEDLTCTTDLSVALADADTVIVAVKPAAVGSVMESIGEHVRQKGESPVIVSVAGGVMLSELRHHFGAGKGVEKLVRAMPNVACGVCMGVTGLFGESAPAVERASEIFDGLGWVVQLPSETLLDVFTGLGASGPAFVAVMLEALADGAVKMGLPRPIAQMVAAQMTAGSAMLAMGIDGPPAVLKNMVASPAGTTIAGLHVLESSGVRGAFISAIEAATQRARERLAQLH